MEKKKREKKRRANLRTVWIVAILFIAGSLLQYNYTMKNMEETRTYNTLRHWTEQGAVTLEKKMDVYFGLLESLGVYLRNCDLDDEVAVNCLKDTLRIEGSDFQYLAASDREGNTVASNGFASDISDKEYFREGMEGKSGVLHSAEREGGIIFYAPLYDDVIGIKGVVYGEMDRKHLDVVKEESREIRLESFFVADENGDYILKRGTSDMTGTNIFDDLWKMGSSVSLAGIRAVTGQGDTIQTDIKKGKENLRVVLTPAHNKGLFLMAVMSRETIKANIKTYMLGAVALALKVIFSTICIICVYLHYQKVDRKYINKLNARLMLNEETYKITAKSCDICVFTYDGETEQVHFLNDKYKDFMMDQEILSVPILLQRLAKTNPHARPLMEALLESPKSHKLCDSCTVKLKLNGKIMYLRISITNVYDKDGEFVRAVGSVEDVTNNETDKMKLQKETDFRNTLLADCVGYMIVNAKEDRILDCSYKIANPKQREQYTYTNVLESALSKRVSPEYWNELTAQMSCAGLIGMCENGEHVKILEYLSSTTEEDHVWMSCEIHVDKENATGNVIAYLVYRNIDNRKRSQEKLVQQAQIDVLTGIFNRTAGTAQIEERLKKECGPDRVHAFAMVDLDNFKQLNDRFGHMWGDKALYEMACIMKKHCRNKDVICRLGGDEFVVFLNDIPRDVVQKNIEALSRKLHISYEKEGLELEVSASIGVALIPDDGKCFKEIYEAGDSALYKVKQEAKGGYCISGKEVLHVKE